MKELWLYRGAKSCQFIDQDVANIQTSLRNVTIRVVYPLMQFRPSALHKAMSALKAIRLLVDPCTHERYSATPVSKTQVMFYPYLYDRANKVLPSKHLANYMAVSDCKRTGVIVCPAIEKMDQGNMYEIMGVLTDRLQEIRDMSLGSDILLELLLDPGVVQRAEQRQQLLGWLLPLEIEGVIVRVQWPTTTPYSSLDDRAMLGGYKDLIEACSKSRVRTYFPGTGLTGLLLVSWGASGFGVGASDRFLAWRRPVYYKRAPGSRQKHPRRFLEALMDWVDVRLLPLLMSQMPDLGSCLLPCCAGASHHDEYRHYIWTIAKMADSVSGCSCPEKDMRLRIRAAAARWASAQRSFPGRLSTPPHLRVWQEILP